MEKLQMENVNIAKWNECLLRKKNKQTTENGVFLLQRNRKEFFLDFESCTYI